MQLRCILALAVCAPVFLAQPTLAQVIGPVRRFSTEGTIKSIRPGAIAITDRTGKSWQMHFGSRKDGRVALGGSRVFVAQPPNIEIEGELGPGALERGFPVRFEGFVNDKGELTAPISSLVWADAASLKPGVRTDRKKTDERGHLACVVSGTVESLDKNMLTLHMPRSRYASKGKLLARLAENAKVTVKTRDVSKVREGDRVTEVSGVELNTGDLVIQELKIRLADHGVTGPTSKDVKQDAGNSNSAAGKDEKLSDATVAPRQVRSQHYVVQTDLSDRDARMLLDRLEQMLGLVARYYGRPQPAPVECYVVSDLKGWPAGIIPEDAQEKIANKEGLTKTLSAVSRAGRQTRAAVFACNDVGVVQHEAVHAYCQLVFGGTGPTWYSEGMAEMGKYWKEGQPAVEIDERVVKFLKKTKPHKTLKEIVAPGQLTGDSWKEYAWRWALCHLLANNPNYNRHFKELGIGLMMQRPGVSLSKFYGSEAQQLAFEYDHFLDNIENGYRADLCAWRWNHTFEPVDKTGQKPVNVLAKAGWQPALHVEASVDYEYLAKGEWQLDGTGAKSTANGDQQGTGKLMAVVMQDFKVSAPIPLGAAGKFRAPSTGDLYLRCGEAWSKLGDNSGGLTVYFRLPKE